MVWGLSVFFFFLAVYGLFLTVRGSGFLAISGLWLEGFLWFSGGASVFQGFWHFGSGFWGFRI